VFSVALHPEKQILATASDDRTWKLWGLPTGELILTGHGHSDWVAGCDFHPSYVVFFAKFMGFSVFHRKKIRHVQQFLKVPISVTFKVLAYDGVPYRNSRKMQ